jgi:hypothetical protein
MFNKPKSMPKGTKQSSASVSTPSLSSNNESKQKKALSVTIPPRTSPYPKRKCSEVSDPSPHDGETDNDENNSSSTRSTSSSSSSGSVGTPTDSTINSDMMEDDAFVRRSVRDPAFAYLQRSDVRKLLAKILANDEDSVILKIKNHMHADVNSVVLDNIIAALHKNKVCQALYAQNLLKAMGDDQLAAIVELCKKKKIWCVNLGENYNVSKPAWELFCRELPNTFITHLYVSEHTISIDLKNKMRDQIRANRKKHDLHCSMKNIEVIEKCTNMWWYVRVAVKHFSSTVLMVAVLQESDQFDKASAGSICQEKGTNVAGAAATSCRAT